MQRAVTEDYVWRHSPLCSQLHTQLTQLLEQLHVLRCTAKVQPHKRLLTELLLPTLHSQVLMHHHSQLRLLTTEEHILTLRSHLYVRIVLIVNFYVSQMQHLQQIVLPVLERHIPATAVCLQHIISLLIKLLIGRATQDID